MSTQTGSISFESTKGIHNYAKQNFSTLSQVLGQFATCGTGTSTTAKVATIVPENSNWTLQEGTTVTVTFSSANTTTTPTLNVNGTGAKQIRDSEGNELTKAAREWAEGAAIAFTYDGTYWRIQDSNLMERVHTAETEIEQTANNVLIKATENDTTAAQGGQHLIESFINVAPSGVTISADKVNIEGATIFTGNGRLSQTSLNNVYATKDDLVDVSSGAEITKSISGERSIITKDAADLPLLTLDPVYGESVQNGTPTPNAPIYIQALKSPHRFPGGDTLEVTIPGRSEDNKEIWGNYSGSATRTLRSDGTYERTYTGTYHGIGITFYGKTSLSVGDEFYVSCSFRNDSSVNISIAIYCMELDSSGTRVYTGLLVNGTGASAGWGTVEAGTEKRFTMKCVWTQSCQDLLNNGGCIRLTIQKTSSGNDPITMFHPMINMGSSVQDWTPEGHLGIISKSGDNQVLDITYLDLKGNELHGLINSNNTGDQYIDTLDIDASGHAIITKRTLKIYGSELLASNYGDNPKANNTLGLSMNPIDPVLFNKVQLGGKTNGYPLPIATFLDGSTNVSSWGGGSAFLNTVAGTTNGYPHNMYCCVSSTDYANVAAFNTALQGTLANEYVITGLNKDDWYTIDLGYVDLPQVTDGSTVHVAAEVQPVISGSWWTKAGESVGKLAQQNKKSQGELEAPYSEVEWVESNGKQFVYLDWKPKIATWGFEIDFLNKNAVNTTAGAWNASTNINGFGSIFGVRNASRVNSAQLSSYGSGILQNGTQSNTSIGFKTDKTRQQMKYKGTTLTKPDGTTATISRSSETANKAYANMAVFCVHDGLRRCGNGYLLEPSTTRIYSLKFYDSTTLECDLVGAIRKRDGVTGLYDKIAGKFYPAPGMTYGEIKNDLGKPQDAFSSIKALSPQLSAYNDINTRMLNVNAPMLDKLEDGQVINLTYLYAIGASYQTTELAGWDDTGNNSYVYVKLTLSDGSTTEWIPCFYNGTTRLTTHYYAGYPLTLTYRENVFIGATATSGGYSIMRGFWVDPEYNTDTQYDKFSDSVIAGKNGIKRYTLCMKDDAGNWTSIVNQANNTAVSGKTCYTGGLQLGKILYAVSGAEYAAGASSGVMAQTYPGFDFRYSVNGVQNAAATELQLRKPIYLIGELDEDTGLFYLDTTKWWTQTEPTTEDGKTYILMGSAYGSYYAAFLAAKNPTYKFINGKFQNLEDLAVQETHKIYYRTTAASNKPSTGPSTWVTTATNVYNTWTTKVPPLASGTDSSASGYTKYPFLYTCEQRRLANSTIECTDVTLDENTTVIDGGQIITNSITASQIAADAVTAEKIDVTDLQAIGATIGGFDITTTAIKTKNVAVTSNADNSIALSSADFTRTINGTSRAGLRLAIGDKFGVTGDGAIYASSVDLTGKITATSGTIGGCTISNGVLQVANANITGTISGNKINASEINIGSLAGEIGGRNLLLDTKNEKSQLYSSTALMYWGFSFTGNLPVNTYTISFDMKSSNGTDKIYFSIANNTSTIQRIADSVIPTTSYTKYSITFNYTGTSTSNGFFITSCASHGSPVNQGNSGTVYIKNVKLEKGNRATDWTPAPEDVAATATTYITDIDTNKGITIKPSDSSGNDYLQINSTDIKFMRNNVDVMNLTDSSFRIGSASGYHSTINTSGLHIWSGAESTATNEVASFGTTARVGKTNSSRFLMNADSLQGYNSSNKLYFEVSSSGIKYGTDLTNSGTTYTAATTTQVSESNNAANTIVTVYPTAIDYAAGTATLAVKCMRGTTAITPSAWKWTKGTSTTSIGTNSTLQVTDLNAVYNCTVTIAV